MKSATYFEFGTPEKVLRIRGRGASAARTGPRFSSSNGYHRRCTIMT